LARIASQAPDVRAMRGQAESESKLLTLYHICLPPLNRPCNSDVTVDEPSVHLLQQHNRWVLQRFDPATVGADGNCLFRAVSLALYGYEKHHVHLRLLTAIEALLYPALYDDSSMDYYGPYRADDRLMLSTYGVFVQELARDSSYYDMLTVLGLSSVIQKPIQTRWPLIVNTTESCPMMQLVAGRSVATMHPVHVLWSTTVKSDPPKVNHFVPLIDVKYDECVADLCPSEELNDDDDDANVENINNQTPRAAGHQLNGHFFSNVDCVECLCSDSYQPLYDSVPTGIKENVMFKIKMLTGTDTSKYWDDCGAWVGSHGKKTYHLPGELSELRLGADGLYGRRQRVEGKTAVVAMDPQLDNVIIMHRLYSKLGRHNAYQQRITYIEGYAFFIAEYIGEFPESVEPHGNAKTGSEYVRSHPQVITDIKTALKSNKQPVKKTYTDLKCSADSDGSRPRDRKQVKFSLINCDLGWPIRRPTSLKLEIDE